MYTKITNIVIILIILSLGYNRCMIMGHGMR